MVSVIAFEYLICSQYHSPGHDIRDCDTRISSLVSSVWRAMRHHSLQKQIGAWKGWPTWSSCYSGARQHATKLRIVSTFSPLTELNTWELYVVLMLCFIIGKSNETSFRNMKLTTFFYAWKGNQLSWWFFDSSLASKYAWGSIGRRWNALICEIRLIKLLLQRWITYYWMLVISRYIKIYIYIYTYHHK